LFDTGVKFAVDNNFKKAEKNFKTVISATPDNYPSHFNLSLLYFRQNKYELCLKYAQKAAELNPFDMRIHKLLASTHTMLKDYGASQRILVTITEKDRTDIDSHKKLGALYLRANNIQSALAELTLTRNLSPSDLNGSLLFAAADAMNNDFEKALARIQNFKGQLTDDASRAFYGYLLEKNGRTEEADALYAEIRLLDKDHILADLIDTVEENVVSKELENISYIQQYANTEISRRMADKIGKETIFSPVSTSSEAAKTRPLNLKATLTETWETYARTPRTSSPINGLNVTSNLKVSGRTANETDFSGEWEGFFNRWDNNKLDYYKINANKRNDYEVDIGKFSAKHFPTLVSFPTVLEGVSMWKKITPSAFVPTPAPAIAGGPGSPVNLGEIYRNNYVDNRPYQDIEMTVVFGRTQERKDFGDRREKNENTTESSGQFEQWTQSYRLHSKLNKFLEAGTSLSITQDISNKTIVSESTVPIESAAFGVDSGIDLLDGDLTVDSEVAYGNYDEDTFDMVDKHLRDFAYLMKSKYQVMDTVSLNYELKKIGRNFKVEGASQTQDKTSHTIDFIYKPKNPRMWFPSSHSIQFKPEIVSPDGGGESKIRYSTVQSVTDFKLPQDSKFIFDYKYYHEIDKCDCTNYQTMTFKNSFEYNLNFIQTKLKPSYTFERKDDMVLSPTDEKTKEYIFNIENTSIKNLELDYSFERERKKYNGATTKSYRQYVNTVEAKYTFIPSRLDAAIKASNDYKNPSDTNKTDISTLAFEANYTSKNGDNKFNVKYEKKNNLYVPWSDTSAYYQQYLRFKYTRKF
jgi:tetratricopeptide (TPR) repeat protein